jgi:hypothetical protein
MKTKPRIRRFLIPAPALGLMGGFTLCHAQPGAPPRDGLALLKDALQAAGASALTSMQERGIRDLIAGFRESHRSPPQNNAVQDVRTALPGPGKHSSRIFACLHKYRHRRKSVEIRGFINFMLGYAG